jgi:hypothetical protein
MDLSSEGDAPIVVSFASPKQPYHAFLPPAHVCITDADNIAESYERLYLPRAPNGRVEQEGCISRYRGLMPKTATPLQPTLLRSRNESSYWTTSICTISSFACSCKVESTGNIQKSIIPSKYVLTTHDSSPHALFPSSTLSHYLCNTAYRSVTTSGLLCPTEYIVSVTGSDPPTRQDAVRPLR